MFIPALDAISNREYVWMIGDPVPSVGLWVRYGEDESEFPAGEYPIYQNTRGKAMFNSTNPGVNTSAVESPTAAFWDALRQLHDGTGDRIDVGDCEWYEREFVNSLLGVLTQDEEAYPEEIGELLAHAEDAGGDR